MLSKRDVIYVVTANDASRTEKESAVEKFRGRTPFPIEVDITRYAGGSVLVSMGNTLLICGVTIQENVPRWVKEQGVSSGWLRADYSMPPDSTQAQSRATSARGATLVESWTLRLPARESFREFSVRRFFKNLPAGIR